MGYDLRSVRNTSRICNHLALPFEWLVFCTIAYIHKKKSVPKLVQIMCRNISKTYMHFNVTQPTHLSCKLSLRFRIHFCCCGGGGNVGMLQFVFTRFANINATTLCRNHEGSCDLRGLPLVSDFALSSSHFVARTFKSGLYFFSVGCLCK